MEDFRHYSKSLDEVLRDITHDYKIIFLTTQGKEKDLMMCEDRSYFIEKEKIYEMFIRIKIILFEYYCEQYSSTKNIIT
jgi:hypothetical protein